MRVVGIDPGKRNTAAVVVSRVWGRYPSIRVLRSCLLDLQPDVEVNARLPHICQVVSQLLQDLRPDMVVAERFVVRPGKGMGNVAEIINQFLGILYCCCARRGIPLHLVMPSVHKTWRARERLSWCLPTDHEVDAASLATYGHRRLAHEQ